MINELLNLLLLALIKVCVIVSFILALASTNFFITVFFIIVGLLLAVFVELLTYVINEVKFSE